MTELLFAFGAGLLSSMHCVGMCGPIVMAGSVTAAPIQIDVQDNRPKAIPPISIILPQMLYHLGRSISYSILGLTAGIIGASAFISPRLQRPITIVFGILMIIAALFQLDVFKSRRNGSKSRVRKILRTLVKSSSLESRFLVGFFTPLLPCGLLYGMVLYAASLHSPLLAAASMGLFALGAVPALMTLATVSSKLSGKFRMNGTRFAVLFIMAMGILTILRGAGIYHASFSVLPDPQCGTTHQPIFSN